MRVAGTTPMLAAACVFGAAVFSACASDKVDQRGESTPSVAHTSSVPVARSAGDHGGSGGGHVPTTPVANPAPLPSPDPVPSDWKAFRQPPGAATEGFTMSLPPTWFASPPPLRPSCSRRITWDGPSPHGIRQANLPMLRCPRSMLSKSTSRRSSWEAEGDHAPWRLTQRRSSRGGTSHSASQSPLLAIPPPSTRRTRSSFAHRPLTTASAQSQPDPPGLQLLIQPGRSPKFSTR